MPLIDFSGQAQSQPIKTVTDPTTVTLISDTDNVLISTIDPTRRGTIVKNTSASAVVTVRFALLTLNPTTSAIEAKFVYDVSLQPSQEYLTDFPEIVPRVAITSSIGGSVSLVELKH
ncbi:MAG TPA: hypothetical protein V6D11_14975 [Waterburya sp.]|jgi:hypothetical protein